MSEALSPTSPCPCGSTLKLQDCCLPRIEGKKKVETAEALLRARYTAFVLGKTEYVMATHHSRTVGDIKRDEVEDWSKNSKWLGLQILQKEGGGASDPQGTLTFHARYEAQGKVQDHYEHSLFERENGEWRFVDAQGLKPGPLRRTEPKVGRNDVCPCGSGKKYKKCHEGKPLPGETAAT